MIYRGTYYHRNFEKAKELIEGKEVLVISHKDADGMLSYSLLNKYLGIRRVMFVHTLTKEVIDNLPTDVEAYIFLDVGGGFEKYILKTHKDKNTIMIDHHPPSVSKINLSKSHYILNSYLLGIDGNKDITTTGMVYLFLKSTHPFTITEHFYVPASAAYADMQTQNGFTSYNRVFLENAVVRGEIREVNELLLPALSIKPLYKSIEYFMNDKGIEFTSYDAVAFLNSIGIKPYKYVGMKRVPIKAKDLSEEEKIKLSTHLVIELESRGIPTSKILAKTHSIKGLFLMDEFVSLVNACVKLGKYKEGIRFIYDLNDISKIYDEYRTTISAALNEAYRKGTQDNYFWYVFQKNMLRDASLTGTISTIINNTRSYDFVFIGCELGNEIKFSLRSSKINVGEITRNFCSKHGCVGNGHMHAAGGIMDKNLIESFKEQLLFHLR